MTTLQFEADIEASPERVFDLLAGLRDYDQWLPRSSAFHGTEDISEGPIGVGTTYVEGGPFGVRYGKVTALSRPTLLAFEQPMTIKPRMMGIIGIRLRHILTPVAQGTHLYREVELTPHGLVRYAMPFIVKAFRTENERMLKVLKAFAEANPAEV